MVSGSGVRKAVRIAVRIEAGGRSTRLRGNQQWCKAGGGEDRGGGTEHTTARRPAAVCEGRGVRIAGEEG